MASNRLIESLPARDRARLLGAGEVVDLVRARVLDEHGTAIRHVYFPTGGVISLLAGAGRQRALEVALVGDEGVSGLPAAFGAAPRSPFQARVRSAGTALRVGAGAFGRELAETPSLRKCIDRYAVVMLGQFARAARCNRFHGIEQRLARRLLVASDRAHSPTFHGTHESLADLLGVRRVGVTEAAGGLQRGCLIDYRRGIVTILDRGGLERRSCACYREDLRTYARLIGR